VWSPLTGASRENPGRKAPARQDLRLLIPRCPHPGQAPTWRVYRHRWRFGVPHDPLPGIKLARRFVTPDSSHGNPPGPAARAASNSCFPSTWTKTPQRAAFRRDAEEGRAGACCWPEIDELGPIRCGRLRGDDAVERRFDFSRTATACLERCRTFRPRARMSVLWPAPAPRTSPPPPPPLSGIETFFPPAWGYGPWSAGEASRRGRRYLGQNPVGLAG